MAGPDFDPDAVRALAEILVQTGLTEIEIEQKDARIRVVRAAAQVVVTPAVQGAAPATAAPPPAAPPAPGAPPAAPAVDAIASHPGVVPSPMVGVAYLAPEPGAPPYVTQGTQVEEGQTLLLIEAMKTFNQIKAPRAGTVTRILVQSGAPVEYGEPLVIIE